MRLHSAEDFKRFYEKHAPKVRGMLFRLVGESALSDLTQETFMRAWENRDKFRGESEASTWLYRISYNCAVDYLRKNKKGQLPDVEVLVRPTQEDLLSGKETVDLMLSALDIEHRGVVILFYFEDLSVKEIAESLLIPEGTVKSRLNAAREKMNHVLMKKGVTL